MRIAKVASPSIPTAPSAPSSAAASTGGAASADSFSAAASAAPMSLAATGAPSTTVQEGDSGGAVLQLQQALNALGFSCGTADGSFGPHTQQAVQAFQAANGLSADGVVGPLTWSAIEAASSPPPPSPVTTPPAVTTAPASGIYGIGPNASALSTPTYQGCSTPITATTTAAGKPGAVQYTSKLDIDSDGAPNVTLQQDPWHQAQTSLKFSSGYVDASTIPYIVLPPSLASAAGAKLGDLVQVSYQGKSTYAIFADTGPSTKLGEGSMALAQQLGIDSDPKYGGLDDQQVQMVILPGSGKAAGIVAGGPAPTFASIQQDGAAAFASAAQQGLVQ